MSIDELNEYENELYMLWQQACKIGSYRRTMASDRVLLNATNVVDISHQLTNGICEGCECEPCQCTQVYGEEE
jgi:hypothetical protein